MTRFSAILGYVVLIVLLSAGTAQSLAGSNTVFSDDIADGNVLTADIGNSQISSAKIRDGHVTAADLGNNAVSGAKVADNSLTGADIDEGTLQLPATVLQAFSKTASVDCTATTNEAITCATISLTMPSVGTLLIDESSITVSGNGSTTVLLDGSRTFPLLVSSGSHTVTFQLRQNCPTCNPTATGSLQVVAIPAPTQQ